MSVRIDNVFFRKQPEIFIGGCRYLQLKGINYIYTAGFVNGRGPVTRHYPLNEWPSVPLKEISLTPNVRCLPNPRKLQAKLDKRVIKKGGLTSFIAISTVRELIDQMYVSVVGMGHLDDPETFRGLIDTKAEKLTIHTCLWELIKRDHVLCVNQPEAPRKVSTKPIRKIRSCNT